MKEILLTRGYVSLVDDEDYERVGKFNWMVSIKKGRDTIYAVREIVLSPRDEQGKRKRHVQTMHRFILNLPPGKVPTVDHWNRNGLDNQKHNLRPTTQQMNVCNRRKTLVRSGKNCTSKFKGVSRNKRRSVWCAHIVANGKQHYLGAFHDEVAAAHAYDSAAILHFGEFSLLNFGSPQ